MFGIFLGYYAYINRAATGTNMWDANFIYISGLPLFQTLCLTFYVHMHGDGIGELAVFNAKRHGYDTLIDLYNCKYIL